MLQRQILVVEDEAALIQLFVEHLTKQGFAVSTAADGETAIRMISENSYDLVLIVLYLPKAHGFQILDHLRHVSPLTGAIVVTGDTSIESAVKAIKRGASDYITKPVGLEHLSLVIANALEVQRLTRGNQCLRQQLKTEYRFGDLIGTSPAMHRVFELIEASFPLVCLVSASWAVGVAGSACIVCQGCRPCRSWLKCRLSPTTCAA